MRFVDILWRCVAAGIVGEEGVRPWKGPEGATPRAPESSGSLPKGSSDDKVSAAAPGFIRTAPTDRTGP